MPVFTNVSIIIFAFFFFSFLFYLSFSLYLFLRYSFLDHNDNLSSLVILYFSVFCFISCSPFSSVNSWKHIAISTAVAAADQAVPVTGLCLWPPLAQKTFTHPFLSSSDLVYSLSFFFRVYSKTYSILSFSFNCSKNEAVIPSIKSFDPDIQWFYENNKCKSTVAPRCVVRPVHFCWAPNTSSI